MTLEHPNRLQTVDRALQLLNCFTPDRPVWGITDLSRELGVAKSMVARLVDTLEAHGYLERNPDTRRYSLGLSLVRLGLVAQSTVGDLYQAARQVMAELTETVGHTTLLCVPRGIHSVCVEQVSSPQQGLRLAIERGTISPLYAGASNRSLLAFLPEERIEEVIKAGLTAFTDRTITDPATLRAKLAEIRRQGWDASGGELTPDVAAVGAPVFDAAGRLVASLSVGFAISRFTPDWVAELVPKVVTAADRLTRRLAGGQ